METKKISFGFMKTKKVEKPVVEEKRDYIECVEEKSIKVIGGEEAVEKPPLVIPMKPNTLITAERLKEIAEKVEKSIEEPESDEKTIKTEVTEEPQENETLDQMAIRELLEEAKKEVKVERSELTVPVPAKPVMEGETESTLEDYESVPIQDFGMAMLRGMGWNPNKEQSKYKLPQLRPKGLGLGADKVISEQKKKSAKNQEEELSIVKNSYVKVVTGKYIGCYGKVVSLDEENRVMVELVVKRETVSLSEFMLQPVTKSEFNKESKVINADSFEEYKRSEKSQTSSRQDSPKVNESREASSSHKSNDVRENKRDKEENQRRDQDRSNGKGKDKSQRNRRDSSSSEDRSRSRKKEKKKYSSCESLSSLSDSDKKKKHRSSRKKYSSDNSDSYKKNRRRSKTPEGKRDIDKKRKGKKKKRDRDRSPNYKKHRK